MLANPVVAKSDFDAIDDHYCSTTMSKQIFLSGWYAHYKLFAETQIDWMEEQKKFTWKDKRPVSARITIIVVALGSVAGLGLWIARANLCATGQLGGSYAPS